MCGENFLGAARVEIPQLWRSPLLLFVVLARVQRSVLSFLSLRSETIRGGSRTRERKGPSARPLPENDWRAAGSTDRRSLSMLFHHG